MLNKHIELLAPARDLATGRVAVDSGADAVYIGGPGFGARRAAGNSLEDIAALVRYARPFGVRVYATLNTLLTDDELDEARLTAQGLVDAGVDALIVQDMAFMRMGLEGVEFHASTQVSNMVPEEVAFLGRAGFARVILERALSLDEIRAIRTACPEDVGLEVFVHGAICVGYSGRCFLSRAMDGSRSGNRGDCSQPCRLAYDLVDGDGHVLVKGRHLLSVRDLDLGARLGELLDAGVSSFKIEGRLKDAAYVRNVVSHYRRLIDKELAARPELCRASVGVSVPDFVPDPAKSFTRGTTEYFLDGPTSGVASMDTPKAKGEYIGRVKSAGRRNGERQRPGRTGSVPAQWITLTDGAADLTPGDGICFFVDGELRGTNINRVEGGRVFHDQSEGIAPGTEIYRNHDHTFARSLAGSRMRRRIGATARVEMSPSRVEITFTDETGVRATVSREGHFEPARDSAKMAAAACDELAKSGDTIFDVRHVEAVFRDDGPPAGESRSEAAITQAAVFVPVSVLAQMRREGLERLTEAREGLAPERHPATEDMTAHFSRTRLGASENVTNRLSERFWRDHGVLETESALELRRATPGEAVMRTRYCIRREIGECPKDGAEGRRRNRVPAGKTPRELFLVRGGIRLKLEFECSKCEMAVTVTADSPASQSSESRETKRTDLKKQI